jgi:hypothetical protein
MNKKIKEQIDYGDYPERMSPDIQRRFEKGETPFSDNPALPKDQNDESEGSSFEQLIASERFKDVVDKVKNYTGMASLSGPNALMELQMLMMQSVSKIKQLENQNNKYLEDLAVELVKKEFSLPENAFQFDVEITSGMGQIDTLKLQKKSEEDFEDEEVVEKFGISPEEAEDDLENFMAAFEKFDLEKAKRRFINSLIQGASKKGHYMFALVQEELNSISSELLNLYGVVMSINDLLYWILPDQMISSMASSGQGVEGTEEVDTTTNPPTIIAKGFMFPILVHEIIKGIMEVLGTQGLPDDPRAAEMVMLSQDTTPYEIWDLRIGPKLWERFTQAYPDTLYEEDMREIQNYLFSRFSMLSTDEFFEVAKMIISGSAEGKKIIDGMVKEIIEELKTQDYDDAMSKYDDDEDDEDGGLEDFLGGLGISLS